MKRYYWHTDCYGEKTPMDDKEGEWVRANDALALQSAADALAEALKDARNFIELEVVRDDLADVLKGYDAALAAYAKTSGPR